MLMSFNPPSVLLLNFVSFELLDESLTFLSFDKGSNIFSVTRVRSILSPSWLPRRIFLIFYLFIIFFFFIENLAFPIEKITNWATFIWLVADHLRNRSVIFVKISAVTEVNASFRFSHFNTEKFKLP